MERRLAISIPVAKTMIPVTLTALSLGLALLTIWKGIQSLRTALGDGALSGWELCLVPWLLVWLALGPFFLASFLWMIWGEERIVVTPEMISLGSNVRRSAREYAAQEIRSLREELSHKPDRLWEKMAPLIPFGGDGAQLGLAWEAEQRTWHNLAFDYRGNTVRFGLQLDEVEAKQILEEIVQAYPEYKPRS